MPSAPPSAGVVRHRALVVLKLGVSLSLLAILFSRMDLDALWATARRPSLAWILVALAIYFTNVLASTWRWQLLLDAQHIYLPQRTLLSSYLVAGFFNNFLPSNIGGDVVRIRDTAGRAGSKTLATTVVLVDRAIGLMGLVLVAALGATMAAAESKNGAPPIWPAWLWVGFLACAVMAAPAVLAPGGLARLLQPLAVVHPGWVGQRIITLTGALGRFRARPGSLVACFAGAVVVQALLVLYYLAVVRALGLSIGLWDLSVIVPVSYLVQMLPVSMNGFGVREAAFSFYFTALGHPIESGVLLPLAATALMILFSLTGAALYVSRQRGRDVDFRHD
jgi:uncharacterized membrane protein YbhN (UPF0104 family)